MTGLTVYNLLSCQKVCDARHYHVNTIFIRFGSKMFEGLDRGVWYSLFIKKK